METWVRIFIGVTVMVLVIILKVAIWQLYLRQKCCFKKKKILTVRAGTGAPFTMHEDQHGGHNGPVLFVPNAANRKHRSRPPNRNHHHDKDHSSTPRQGEPRSNHRNSSYPTEIVVNPSVPPVYDEVVDTPPSYNSVMASAPSINGSFNVI
ncbi:hypothetical protein SNE40_014520 [Patella caerulea]|uniref:Uncharacterized protein n=1 Tax=Patella caerulea TaxID=87958 RepID=A0AAN8JDQ5_PATCE